LLETIKSPARDFDAVGIGEPQRAFYGSQFGMTFPVFVHYGVGLWVREIGGAVDPGSDAHDLVMALYGGTSKGERDRIKARVRSAMKAQTELERTVPRRTAALRLPAHRRRPPPEPRQGCRRQATPQALELKQRRPQPANGLMTAQFSPQIRLIVQLPRPCER
jgi:hypothetical protein